MFQARLSLGTAPLDAFLGGGLRPYGITELAGEAGAGKSQICMQLCATVQLPLALGGLDGGAIMTCNPSHCSSRLTRT